MQRQNRLKKDVEFKQVRSKGRSWANPLVVMYALASAGVNDRNVTRVGISVSKRIGKAVKRNRVKRLIREAVRVRIPELCSGWDVLFIARKPIADAEFVDVQGAVEQLLRRASLFIGARGEKETGSRPMIGKEAGIETVSVREGFGASENCSVEGAARLEARKDAENRPRHG